jgi:hypothetical protein
MSQPSFVLEALTAHGGLQERSLLLGLARLDEHRRHNPDCWPPDLCSVARQLAGCGDLAAWKEDMRSALNQMIADKSEEDQSESLFSMGQWPGSPCSLGEALGYAVLIVVFSLLDGLGTLLWRRLSGSSPRRDKMARAATEIEAILAEM